MHEGLFELGNTFMKESGLPESPGVVAFMGMEKIMAAVSGFPINVFLAGSAS